MSHDATPAPRTSSPATPGRAAPPPRRGNVRALGGPLAWRGVDLVTAAVLGVAFGVAFWAWDVFLYPAVQVALVYPPALSITLGVWLLPAVVGGLVIRRPGAALFTEMVAANLEMLLGNQWGATVLVSGLMQGLGVELVLALVLWRRFGVGTAMAAGAMSALFEVAGWEWWRYMIEFSWTHRFIALGFALVSGVVVAGIGGWALVRALAATGVLNTFPPGQEHLADHLEDEDEPHPSARARG